MRVLVCAVGSMGDVHPLVAVAHSLKQRGHDVYLLANEAYGHLAEEACVEFHAVGTRQELEAVRNHPDAMNYGSGWKIWMQSVGLGSMRGFYQAIEQLYLPGETVLAGAYLCFGARVAQEKFGIPAATLHMNVHTIRSIYGVYAYPPPEFLPDMLPRWYVLPPFLPTWCRRLGLENADNWVISPTMRGPIEAFRQELQLPKMQQHVRDWWNSPDRVICLYPDWWAGEHPDWPQQVVTTNFPFWDRSDSIDLSEGLMNFINTDKDIVVFSPGTSATNKNAYFKIFAKACETLDLNGLVITSKSRPGHIQSKHIRFEKFVPFGKLLPHVKVAVHQAGIGTTAQCLAAGVPQVVMPTLYNHPDTAIRLEKMGVARQLNYKWVNASKLTRALKKVMTSPAIRDNCEKYARLSRKNVGLETTCHVIEGLL